MKELKYKIYVDFFVLFAIFAFYILVGIFFSSLSKPNLVCVFFSLEHKKHNGLLVTNMFLPTLYSPMNSLKTFTDLNRTFFSSTLCQF